MLLRLDERDPRPLHEQVAAALRQAVTAEQVDRLPPARDLAAALRVNPNTVLRALRQLREEGLVDFRRGRGIRVTADGVLRGAGLEATRTFVTEVKRLGFTRAQVTELIETVW